MSFDKKLALVFSLMILMFGSPYYLSCQEKEIGKLRVFIFSNNGRPLKGVAVNINKDWFVTNDKGMYEFEGKSSSLDFKLKFNGREVANTQIKIYDGYVTEVIGTMNKFGNKIELEIEYPEGVEEKDNLQVDSKKELFYGRLKGTISVSNTTNMVKDAKVIIKGVSGEGVSDEKGFYEMKIPVGRYTITVIHPEYSTKTVQDVEILQDQEKEVNVLLEQSSFQFDKLVVTEYKIEGGRAVLLDERKESSMVMDIIGAEQMSKSGDSDAASALKRASGVTIFGGKFVLIRGMGERYTKSLLNGADLPSPEPEKKVVPLNIFPVDVVECLYFQKTYTANMPGEFGGGVVNIITKKVPDNFISVSTSVGYVEGTTFKDGLSYSGGSTDFFGFDDGTRNIPGTVGSISQGLPIRQESILGGDGLSQSQLEDIGKSFNNTWEPKKQTSGPNFGLDLTIGDDKTFSESTFRYMASLSYGSSYKTKDKNIKVLSIGNENKLEPNVDYDSVSTSYGVDLGFITDLGFDFNENHSLSFTSLVIRTTEDQAEKFEGYFGSEGTDIRVMELNYVEQMLITNSLKGEHGFSFHDMKLKWNYTYSIAGRDQPDSRKVRYAFEDSVNNFILSDRADGNQRLFGKLDDTIHYFEVGSVIPLFDDAEESPKISFGLTLIDRQRESRVRRFKFAQRGADSYDIDLLQLSPDHIFVSENISEDGFQISEITRSTDQYDATQSLWAGYLMYDWAINPKFDLNIGLRVENSKQKVDTFELFNTSNPSSAELNDTDLLPALNLNWKFHEAMQLRFGYARTLARPDFRELSAAPLDLVVGKGTFIGNPDLKRTVIDNLDLRWEWYFKESENISVALFYKDLTDPIETIIIPGANRITTLQNVDSATNYGIEFEFRKNFEFFGEMYRDLYFGGNISLIHSKVELGDDIGATTSENRPLFGQSPYVFNFSLNYDNPELGLSTGLIYNVFGKRITEVGSEGLPDIKEEPYHSLDFVCNYNIKKNYAVKFKVKNIFGSDSEYTQNGVLVEKSSEPRVFSIGFSYKY